ncbi:dienelactone hydrolase family protein [Flavobacterium endoglycinae]|uniref:Dienelactone hydrolase family protein n=1 Tax=Flavobacterium endoglycinae TaxID=2816357 RepID=A0ABX7QF06_9FLAO|nr:dienelactone hydrolase family protein [Flavobacterium endoglycinae]QSW89290.1 dienelactone hydrolase family protein [Flavobacterium endoglycinae]
MNASYITGGVPLQEAQKALIMLHGRGAGANDILSIARYLNVSDFALIAPQAEGRTWYPYSFLAPINENEPFLSNSLKTVSQVVASVEENGIKRENIYFLGFSQGACLTLEYTSRNADKYGGIIAFTGGLIGDQVYENHYTGDFKNTPIFVGTSDPDFHVPVERVNDSEELLKRMGAAVTKKIYPDMGHTISQDEIDIVNALIFGKE